MEPQNKPTQEQEHVADQLRDFYLRSHKVIDRIMAAHGASYARTRMLMHIRREGPVRSIDLAASFGFAPRTVTEAIDGLERDGLVRRDPDPVDRRAKQISITAEGLAAIDGAEASRLTYVNKVFGVLSPEECEEIARLLGKLNAQLQTLGG